MPRAESTEYFAPACAPAWVAGFGSILRRFILSFGVLVTALGTALLPVGGIVPSASAAPAGTILVYGDSLSAAYGIAQERGWVALLEARLKSERLNYSVANASISGETTSGGLARMRKVLERTRPAITVIELGANDGLRGLPVAQMRKNLEAMINEAKSVGSRVLLVGIKMPPNYGPDYNRAFDAAYRDLAKEHKTGFIPFFFEGFVQNRDFFQPDNLHPTAAAQPILLDTVWKALKPMLK